MLGVGAGLDLRAQTTGNFIEESRQGNRASRLPGGQYRLSNFKRLDRGDKCTAQRLEAPQIEHRLRQFAFGKRLAGWYSNLFVKLKLIEKSQDAETKLQHLTLARNTLEQLRETADNQRRPGGRHRVNISRRAALLLRIFGVDFYLIRVLNPILILIILLAAGLRRREFPGCLNLRPFVEQFARPLEPPGHTKLAADVGNHIFQTIN